MTPAPGSPGNPGHRATTVTLRALEGEPLADQRISDMVVANAHAIAERQGIPVLRITPLPDRIEVTLEAGRVEAIGFAAELRRLTTNWFRHKFQKETLWGEPPPTPPPPEAPPDTPPDPSSPDDADWWKNT